jgi:hypothetical protein
VNGNRVRSYRSRSIESLLFSASIDSNQLKAACLTKLVEIGCGELRFVMNERMIKDEGREGEREREREREACTEVAAQSS